MRLFNWWRLLRETIKIDIYDLDLAYGSPSQQMLSFLPAALPRPGLAVRIASFLWHFVGSLCHLDSFRLGKIPHNRPLFYFGTRNQKATVMPVAACTQGALLVGLDFRGRLDMHGAERFPVAWAYLLSFPFFPLVLFRFLTARGYQKETFRFAFDNYWLAYGCFLASVLWLRRVTPTCIVGADDYGVFSRALNRAARMESIPIFFMLHASGGDHIPLWVLSADYALLNGEDGLRKFERAGASRTKFFLTGMPKMDGYVQHINTSTTVRAVGICTNVHDPLPRVEQLCQQLRQAFPELPLFLRPHPGDRRSTVWSDLVGRYGMESSDAKTEISFDFLKRVDVIAAGDSNILLEAALLNVFPFYYDFAQTHLDWYGFECNGLVEYVAEPQDVCRRLGQLSEDRPSVRMKAKLYCATVGTPYEGRSGELASAIIEEVVSSGQVDLSQWRRIPDVKLGAYALRDTFGGSSNV